jgi:hypothetical protein
MPTKRRYVVTSEGVPNTRDGKIVADALRDEIGPEPISKRTVDALIRLAADAHQIGVYVNIDQVFDDLVSSGFIIAVDIVLKE